MDQRMFKCMSQISPNMILVHMRDSGAVINDHTQTAGRVVTASAGNIANASLDLGSGFW